MKSLISTKNKSRLKKIFKIIYNKAKDKIMKIISEEELNQINLKNRTDETINKLKAEIKILKTSSNRQQTEKGNKQLKSLTEDFQQLVQVARNAMMKTVSPEIRTIANKIEKIWTTEIYPLVKEYDKCIDEYNKRNNTNLQHISKRTNNEINNSVKTKYFNY